MILIQSATADPDVEPEVVGGWVGLYKDSGTNQHYFATAMANTDAGYAFSGWTVDDGEATESNLLEIASGACTANFGPAVETDEILEVAPGDTCESYAIVGKAYRLQLEGYSGEYEWSVVDGMSKLDPYSDVEDEVTDDDVVAIQGNILTAKHPGRVLLQAQTGSDTFYGRVEVDEYPEFPDIDDIRLYLGTSGQGESVTMIPKDGAAFPENYTVEFLGRDKAVVQYEKTAAGVVVTPLKTGCQYLKLTAQGYMRELVAIRVKNKQLSIVRPYDEDDRHPNDIEKKHLFSDDPITPFRVYANDGETPACTWQSSNESVATVDGSGDVTPVGIGVATITVSAGDYLNDTALVAVRNKPESQISYSYSGDSSFTPLPTPSECSLGDCDGEENLDLVEYKFNVDDVLSHDGSLIVKVPIKSSDYNIQATTAVLDDNYNDENTFMKYDSYNYQFVTGVTTRECDDKTLVSIPLDQLEPYNQIAIRAVPKTSGTAISWDICYENSEENLQNPTFGRAGTYQCSSDGQTKTFRFNQQGEFWWTDPSGTEHQIKAPEYQDTYTDDYGFVYRQYLEFEVRENLVNWIDVSIANENPTVRWLNVQEEKLQLSLFYDEEENGFRDFMSDDGDMYYLNGENPDDDDPSDDHHDDDPSDDHHDDDPSDDHHDDDDDDDHSDHHHSHHNSTNDSISDDDTDTSPFGTFSSDTTTDFTCNDSYVFKVTSENGTVPVFVAGTAGVVKTQLVKQEGNHYFFKIIAIGQPGAKVGIYVNGVKVVVVTVGANASGVISDTTLPFQVKPGASYMIKLTAGTVPTLTAGTPSAFRVEFVNSVGQDHFFRITAVGESSDGSGFYINSGNSPAVIATIA
ncbi:MAG: Ig-like domain-containing protein [Oscillospiraceae bacterium]|nr:Ig-like domain-containing protein [Oscillospiraceae bacterium]